MLRFGSHRFGSSAQIAQPTSNHLKRNRGRPPPLDHKSKLQADASMLKMRLFQTQFWPLELFLWIHSFTLSYFRLPRKFYAAKTVPVSARIIENDAKHTCVNPLSSANSLTASTVPLLHQGKHAFQPSSASTKESTIV